MRGWLRGLLALSPGSALGQYYRNQYYPNQYNPNQYNPNQYNPNQYNPNQYNPNQYNPYQDQQRAAAQAAAQAREAEQGCSTLWNGYECEQFVDTCESGAAAVLAERAALICLE